VFFQGSRTAAASLFPNLCRLVQALKIAFDPSQPSMLQPIQSADKQLPTTRKQFYLASFGDGSVPSNSLSGIFCGETGPPLFCGTGGEGITKARLRLGSRSASFP